jgi:hypothetical protein
VRNFVWLLLSLSKDGVMEAQIIGDPGYQRIECCITGEAENVIDVVVLVRPIHRLDAAIVAVATLHDAGGRPMPSQTLRHVLDDGPHLRHFGVRCWPCPSV